MIVSFAELQDYISAVDELDDYHPNAQVAIKIVKIYREAKMQLNSHETARENMMNECLEKTEEGQFIKDEGGYVVKPDKADILERFMRQTTTSIAVEQKLNVEELDELNLTMKEFKAFAPFIE